MTFRKCLTQSQTRQAFCKRRKGWHLTSCRDKRHAVLFRCNNDIAAPFLSRGVNLVAYISNDQSKRLRYIFSYEKVYIYNHFQESGTTPIFYALSTGILLSRPLTLFSVTAVTCCSSPVVVQALGGPRRCFLIVLCIIIFKEPVPIQKVISIVGMCISLGMYAYGGHILRQKKRVFSDPQSDKCPV